MESTTEPGRVLLWIAKLPCAGDRLSPVDHDRTPLLWLIDCYDRAGPRRHSEHERL